MTELRLNGLRVRRVALASVGAATTRRAARIASGIRGTTDTVVSADVIADTRTDTCKCEDEAWMRGLGLPTLHAGTPVRGPGGLAGISPEYNFTTQQWEAVPEDPKALGSGCTTGRHVCPRLDKVRRRYGL